MCDIQRYGTKFRERPKLDAPSSDSLVEKKNATGVGDQSAITNESEKEEGQGSEIDSVT